MSPAQGHRYAACARQLRAGGPDDFSRRRSSGLLRSRGCFFFCHFCLLRSILKLLSCCLFLLRLASKLLHMGSVLAVVLASCVCHRPEHQQKRQRWRKKGNTQLSQRMTPPPRIIARLRSAAGGGPPRIKEDRRPARRRPAAPPGTAVVHHRCPRSRQLLLPPSLVTTLPPPRQVPISTAGATLMTLHITCRQAKNLPCPSLIITVRCPLPTFIFTGRARCQSCTPASPWSPFRSREAPPAAA